MNLWPTVRHGAAGEGPHAQRCFPVSLLMRSDALLYRCLLERLTPTRTRATSATLSPYIPLMCSDALLYRCLPKEVAQKLREGDRVEATSHEQLTVMFSE